MAETLEQRRDRLNKESIALRSQIKKRRLRLKKVRVALRRTREALARRVGRGFDVSSHQGTVGFGEAKRSGETWVGVKATEGVGFVDPKLAENLRNALASGLRVKVYAFARPDTGNPSTDAQSEVDFFVDTVRRLLPTGVDFISLRDWKAGKRGVVGVCDFEHEPFSATWARNWGSRFIARTGVRATIYGFGASLNPIAMAIEAVFSGVWFAAFVSDWRPFCADSLEDNVYTWQYTSTGHVPGVNGNVDRNKWLG